MAKRYVAGRRERNEPKQFAPYQPNEQRIFVDHDGTEYEIIWPRGRMLLSELERSDDATGERQDAPNAR